MLLVCYIPWQYPILFPVKSGLISWFLLAWNSHLAHGRSPLIPHKITYIHQYVPSETWPDGLTLFTVKCYWKNLQLCCFITIFYILQTYYIHILTYYNPVMRFFSPFSGCISPCRRCSGQVPGCIYQGDLLQLEQLQVCGQVWWDQRNFPHLKWSEILWLVVWN